jgi:hypothetical protein
LRDKADKQAERELALQKYNSQKYIDFVKEEGVEDDGHMPFEFDTPVRPRSGMVSLENSP